MSRGTCAIPRRWRSSQNVSGSCSGITYGDPFVDAGIYRLELVADSVLAVGSLQVELCSADEGRGPEVSEQVRFLLEVRDRLSSVHAVVAQIRAVTELLEDGVTRPTRGDVESLRAALWASETQLVSREVIGPGDYHRFPSGLNARLMGLAFRVGESEGPVTNSHRQVLSKLAERQSTIMSRLTELAAKIGPRGS